MTTPKPSPTDRPRDSRPDEDALVEARKAEKYAADRARIRAAMETSLVDNAELLARLAK